MAFADTIRSKLVTANDVADKLDALLAYQISGSPLYAGTSAGSANAQTGSLSQSPGAYSNGVCFSFKAGFTNTATTSFNLNSLGNVTILDSRTNLALAGGEIVAGGIYWLEYSGSNLYLISGGPSFETWAAAPGGFSANPANAVYRYSRIGKKCTLFVNMPAAGTSNATTFTITLPFTAATISYMAWKAVLAETADNSAYQTTPGIAVIASGGTVVTLYKTSPTGVWTNVGLKAASFQITYEIA